MTSLATEVNVYRLKNDYAVYEATKDGVDTVGVWGSNPHAPTIRISNLLGKRSIVAAFSLQGDTGERVDGTPSTAEAREAIAQLRCDHDFFMYELAGRY